MTAGSNTAVTALVPGGSTSVVTLTGTPNDTYYGVVTVLTGGTIGTAGIQIGVSLDAANVTTTPLPAGAGILNVASNPDNSLPMFVSAGAPFVVRQAMIDSGDAIFRAQARPATTLSTVQTALVLVLMGATT